MRLILLIFIAISGYVTWHLWRLTPGGTAVKITVTALFLLWMVAAFASIGLRKYLPYRAVVCLYEAGQPWLIVFTYLLIAFVLADFARLFNLIPKSWLNDNLPVLLSIAAVIAAVMAAGGIHYRHKYREELSIKTVKAIGRPLTLVLASDLHIGYSNRRDHLAHWIDMINAENPDLVLFGGDIVDIRTEPLVEGGYADEFRRLTAPAFTILGNHEYISGHDDSEQFLAEAGITVLKDSAAVFDGIRIIGRDDRSNPSRKPLSELACGDGLFTILLDHQPYDLGEASAAGIDFQFSGHTHRGQFWPVSWLTDLMYEKSWGHYMLGDTRYYISSGLGIWGPKIRIGSRSEYLVLHID